MRKVTESLKIEDNLLRNSRHSIELVLELTKREIQAKYRGTYVGIVWAFLAPVLMAGLFTLFFAEVFKARWEQFPSSLSFGIAIYSGLLIHGFVIDVMSRAVLCVISHSHLVRKLVFPVQVLPVVVVLSATFHLTIGLIPLIVMSSWSGAQVSWHVLLLPLTLVPLLVLSLGLAWLGASLGVYLRDIAQAMPFIGNALLFLSPIFYARSALPEAFHPFMLVNPITLIVEAIRDIVMKQLAPDFWALSIYLIIAFMIAGLGYAAFQALKRGFIDVL